MSRRVKSSRALARPGKSVSDCTEARRLGCTMAATRCALPARSRCCRRIRINVYRALTNMDPLIEMEVSSRPAVNYRSNGLLQVVLLDQEAETFRLSQIEIDSIHPGFSAA
jgi:CO/xanthine dehydrogenase Mo-binding subunit